MEFAKIKFKINKINGSYVNIIKFLYWTKLQVKSVINTACQSYVLLYLPRDRSGVKKLTYEDYSKSPGIFGDWAFLSLSLLIPPFWAYVFLTASMNDSSFYYFTGFLLCFWAYVITGGGYFARMYLHVWFYIWGYNSTAAKRKGELEVIYEHARIMYEYANIASVASHKRAEVHERAKKSEKVQRESDVFYNALRAYNIGETTFETFYYSFYRDPYHKKIAVRKLK